jgi:hypothetical protein
MLRFRSPSLLALPAALLLGCPPADVDPEPTPPPDYGYAEQEDGSNDSPFDPEEVDAAWDPTANRFFTLSGTMEACDYDASEGWPWTGDEDDFALTIPADGILIMETAWDGGDGDLDWLWWREVPSSGPTGGTASPDHQIDGSGSDMNWDFDDERFDAGDVMVFTFLCKSGGGGDYSMTLEWED